MSFNYNKVFLAGNLTRDPNVRFFANERAVADFGLAVNRRYKVGEETKEEVTFVDVEAWGRTAELVGQYLTKGKSCFIEGRLKLDQWEDKDSGQKRSKLKIVADSVQFTSPRTAGDNSATYGGPAPSAGDGAPRHQSPGPQPQPLDDEPPF